MLKSNTQTITSKIRPIEDELLLDELTDAWVTEHSALTANGSLVVGIFRERDDYYANWRHYIDCNVLPQMFDCIDKAISENKHPIYFYEDAQYNDFNDSETYITKILSLKYKTCIGFRKLDKKIVPTIQEMESINNVAIITVSNSCVFTMKYLIENS